MLRRVVVVGGALAVAVGIGSFIYFNYMEKGALAPAPASSAALAFKKEVPMNQRWLTVDMAVLRWVQDKTEFYVQMNYMKRQSMTFRIVVVQKNGTMAFDENMSQGIPLNNSSYEVFNDDSMATRVFYDADDSELFQAQLIKDSNADTYELNIIATSDKSLGDVQLRLFQE